jgi:putative hemolysin
VPIDFASAEILSDAELPEPTFSYASEEVSRLSRVLIRTIETLSGQPRIKRLYVDYQKRNRPPELFWEDAVQGLRLDLRLNRRPERAIPAKGPLVIIANHPFGVVDGIILCRIVSQIRSDYMIMTHRVLYQAPEVRRFILPIDFTGTRAGLATNVRSRAAGAKLLAEGGALIVFPSGGVAVSPTFHGRAIDLEWKTFAAKLIMRARADVLPVFFHGQNSRLYLVAARLHQTLKLAMLFHEVSNKIGRSISVSIGDVIANESLRALPDRQAITHYLQVMTEAARRARG